MYPIFRSQLVCDQSARGILQLRRARRTRGPGSVCFDTIYTNPSRILSRFYLSVFKNWDCMISWKNEGTGSRIEKTHVQFQAYKHSYSFRSLIFFTDPNPIFTSIIWLLCLFGFIPKTLNFHKFTLVTF